MPSASNGLYMNTKQVIKKKYNKHFVRQDAITLKLDHFSLGNLSVDDIVHSSFVQETSFECSV